MVLVQAKSIKPKQRIINYLKRAKKNNIRRITLAMVVSKAKVSPEFALKTMSSLEKTGKVKKNV